MNRKNPVRGKYNSEKLV